MAFHHNGVDRFLKVHVSEVVCTMWLPMAGMKCVLFERTLAVAVMHAYLTVIGFEHLNNKFWPSLKVRMSHFALFSLPSSQ